MSETKTRRKTDNGFVVNEKDSRVVTEKIAITLLSVFQIPFMPLSNDKDEKRYFWIEERIANKCRIIIIIPIGSGVPSGR